MDYFKMAAQDVMERAQDYGWESQRRLREQMNISNRYAVIARQDNDKLLVLLAKCLHHIDQDWCSPSRDTFVEGVKSDMMSIGSPLGEGQ